jgi:NTP pyrophosphatase (non-canonical NTP hydrolase)
VDLDDYQARCGLTDQRPGESGDAVLIPLLGLAGETGTLLSEYKKLLRDGSAHRGFVDQVREELGDILWYAANLATKFGLSFSEIAESNLTKTQARWSGGATSSYRLFDEDMPPAEQLPRRFSVRFEHQLVDGKQKMVVTRDGRQAGNPLTDNAHEDDGYRYHDAYHFTFAALLGWSPVTRRNLKCKRKSTPEIDEIEDGGRGWVIEEGIVALAYAYASQHDFFASTDRVDGDLLKTIRILTDTAEVRERSAKDWEDAIVMGSRMFMNLRENRGGVLDCDLEARSVSFERLPVSQPLTSTA